MTISESVFRSTSMLERLSRAQWVQLHAVPCWHHPHYFAFLLDPSARFRLVPAAAILSLAKKRDSAWWQEAKMKESVSRQHLGTKALGDPHMLCIEMQTGTVRKPRCTKFSILCIWQMVEEYSTYLSISPHGITLTIKNKQGYSNSGKFLYDGKCNSMQVNAG